MSVSVQTAAQEIVAAFRAAGTTLTTVESCTGGMVGAAVTGVAGASNMYDRGFITYTNESKAELVGVPAALIETHGAVSEQVARAMAEGGLAHGAADIAVAITGIAGPGGGSPEKPVGLVHIAAARRGGETRHERFVFPGDRDAVRESAAEAALRMALALL